jgi:hypothetical protein
MTAYTAIVFVIGLLCGTTVGFAVSSILLAGKE